MVVLISTAKSFCQNAVLALGLVRCSKRMYLAQIIKMRERRGEVENDDEKGTGNWRQYIWEREYERMKMENEVNEHLE